MIYKKTVFTPEVENLLAEGLAKMLGLFIMRKGLLWSVTDAYCKGNKWTADCILTTFSGVWLKNAGKKKSFALEGKEMLVPFFCLDGCRNILLHGKGYPLASFHIAGGSCFLDLKTGDGSLSPLKGKDLNAAVPAEFIKYGMITIYDRMLPDTLYMLTDFDACTIRNGKCAWGSSFAEGVLENAVPAKMKGFLYYGIPADGLYGFWKQVIDKGYYII